MPAINMLQFVFLDWRCVFGSSLVSRRRRRCSTLEEKKKIKVSPDFLLARLQKMVKVL